MLQYYEKFLDEVCKKHLCGSQRCDRSEEWVEGCKLYQIFKQIQKIMDDRSAEKLKDQTDLENLSQCGTFSCTESGSLKFIDAYDLVWKYLEKHPDEISNSHSIQHYLESVGVIDEQT